MWKIIPKFEQYEASEDGRIRHKDTVHELLQSVKGDGTGMPVVSFVLNKQIYTVEVRFVIACTYLGVDINARPKPKFEYIDGNKWNNSVSNIRIKSADSLESEEWRPIEGFEDSYAISNFGRVKRLAHTDSYIRKDTGKEVERKVGDLILKLNENDEYYQINLRCGDRSEWRSVHRMVAEAFIPNIDNLPQVNHIDGDRHNNKVSNLEWVTCQDNIHHAIQTGLRKSTKGTDHAQKDVKCLETNEIFKSIRAAAKHFNLSENYLRDCITEKRDCHGYHFEQIVVDRRLKCLDTGQIFNCLEDAKQAFGFDMSDSIKRRTCKDGWTFCYLRDNIEDEEAYLWECRNRYSEWPRANKRWEENNGSK